MKSRIFVLLALLTITAKTYAHECNDVLPDTIDQVYVCTNPEFTQLHYCSSPMDSSCKMVSVFSGLAALKKYNYSEYADPAGVLYAVSALSSMPDQSREKRTLAALL